MVNYCGQISLDADCSDIANYLASYLASDKFSQFYFGKNVLYLNRIKAHVANTLKRVTEYYYLDLYKYVETESNDVMMRVNARLCFKNKSRFSAFKRNFSTKLPESVYPRLKLYVCRLRRTDWLRYRIGSEGELEFQGCDDVLKEMSQNLPEVIERICPYYVFREGLEGRICDRTVVYFTSEEWKRDFIELFNKSLLVG